MTFLCKAQIPKDAQHKYLGCAGAIGGALLVKSVNKTPFVAPLIGLFIGTGFSYFTGDLKNTTWGAFIGTIGISCKFNFDSSPGQQKRKYITQ